MFLPDAIGSIVPIVVVKLKSKKVIVQNNRTLVLDFELESDVLEGHLVTVTTHVEGQVAAMNRQLSSNTILILVT